MSELFDPENTRFLEQQIVLEEKKYIDALKADAEFHVLKTIRQRINSLKAHLCEARMAITKRGGDDAQKIPRHRFTNPKKVFFKEPGASPL